MRRTTIAAVRTLVVLLLLAAILDLPLPGRSRDRVRIHLVDRSSSVLAPGPAESLLPRDADDLIARDAATRAASDTVTWASFGRAPAFESRTVDPTATDLAAALGAALARNPTEIILYTDGRGDPGSALFLCRERGVPVHLFPLGPTSVKDARIVRVEAPADAAPGSPVPLAVVLESTVDAKTRIKAGGDVRDIDLAARVPTRLAFTLPGPGEFRIDIETPDACDENNHVRGQVFARSDRRKLLLLSAGFPALPGFDVTVAQRVPTLWPYDAVIVDNVALPPADLQALASWVRSGGGLLLLGGPRSYALGGWKGTPLEELSPLKIQPDLKIAVVFGIDASGSMKDDFDPAVQVLLDARGEFDADDDLSAMTFADDAKMLEFAALRKERPTGGTSLLRGIETARRHLEPRPAGRKVIVLMTDGETRETPEEIRAAVAGLKDIALIAITTKKEVPGASKNVPLKDWNTLRKTLHDVTLGIQDVFRADPGTIDLRVHPVSSGVSPGPLAGINRTTAKLEAQVIATVGRPPAQDPVLAFGQSGEGRVGAFTIGYDARFARLFSQAIEHVAGEGDAGLRLAIDPPFVRATGSYNEARFETTLTRVEMNQVASNAWEGRLPDGLSGTVVVRKGRARAAATIPCAPEFEFLGVDRAALERIARETGGRVLGSPDELAALPRPATPAPRSGRPLFLIAALALVFVELAISTFWKV